MYKKNGDRKEKIQPMDKDKVHEILKKYNITLENDEMYDATYVYSMIMADFMGKSIPNEQYAAMYVKDKIDDVDQPDGYIFNEWYAKLCFAGVPIDWEEFV
jgi:predicted transcriptional regulator YdeE